MKISAAITSFCDAFLFYTMSTNAAFAMYTHIPITHFTNIMDLHFRDLQFFIILDRVMKTKKLYFDIKTPILKFKVDFCY